MSIGNELVVAHRESFETISRLLPGQYNYYKVYYWQCPQCWEVWPYEGDSFVCCERCSIKEII